jgi:putative DNA-invertase from lambdoid prophage Rac
LAAEAHDLTGTTLPVSFSPVGNQQRTREKLPPFLRTVINGLIFNGATKDPMQQAVRDSLIAFMAAMAQAQAEVVKEAQKAGIAHARENDNGTKYRGRKPTFTREQFVLVGELLSQGISVSAIAKTTGLKRQSVYRIQSDPERQRSALRAWYGIEPQQPAN